MYYRLYRYWLCLLIYILANGTIWTQVEARVLYPVKQNHLWGFMSKAGDMLIPPRYDAIGEQVQFLINTSKESETDEISYRLVEFEGKLGIINQNLKEILPCTNDFIHPISVSQFLVRQEAGYTVLDSTGRNVLGRHYPQLEFAGATDDGAYLYTIFNQGKKGIINAQGDTLLPCQYAEIKPLKWQNSPFLIHVRPNESSWRLVARGGKILLNEVADVKSPHPALLLIAVPKNQPQEYQAYDPQGRPIAALATFMFKSGEYLSPELVSLTRYVPDEAKDIQALFQVRKQQILPQKFLDFRHLDGYYCTASAKRTDPQGRSTYLQETLLTPQGEMVDTGSWFLRVDVWDGSLNCYRVRDRNGWGVINRSGQKIVPTEYDSIGRLEDGLALVVRKNAVGMINADGQAIVPAEYMRIHRQDKTLTLEKKANATILYINDSSQIVSLREYQKLRTLTVDPPDLYRIADRVGFESLHKPTATSNQSVANPATYDVEQKEVPDSIRLERWFSQDSSQITTPNLTSIARGIDAAFLAIHDPPNLGSKYFMRFYEKTHIEPAEYLQRLVIGSKKICVNPQHLFADSIGKLAQKSVLGFRIFDLKKDWHYAPALGQNGRFYLLGRDAEPLRSAADTVIAFTFVGTAKNGLLRVCVGGELVNSDPSEIPKEALPSLNSLLSDFHLKFACGTLAKSNGYLEVRSLPGDSVRWGVLDTLGRWVVPPIYDYLEENIGGQMVARRGEHYGVVNAQGDTIVPFQYLKIKAYKGFWRVNTRKIGEVYFNWRGHQILDVGSDSLSIFQDGHAAHFTNGRWSYIDKLGKPVGNTDYLKAKPFGEGLAAVQLDSTQWSFVDTSGQLHGRLPAASYQDLGYFASGRCWFRRAAKFGFLDSSLQEIIPARFHEVANFNQGRAIVKIGPSVAVIDTAGNFLIELGRYSHLSSWNEAGLAVATLADGRKKYLVDLEGNPLHDEPFDDIILEGGPLYPAKQGRSWGYIDGQGKQVIPLTNYSRAAPFAEERARVMTHKNGDSWIFINIAGEPINKQTYNSAEDFSQGIAYVRNTNGFSLLLQHDGQERTIPNCDNMFVDGSFIGCNPKGKKAFFADHDGNPTFLHTYEEIKPFGAGEMAFVKKYGRWGIIDRRGMLLVACKYYFFEDRPDGIFKLGPPVFGIYDREGMMVVPVEFDDLVLLEKGIFRVERGEKIGYLSTNGKEVWPLQN